MRENRTYGSEGGEPSNGSLPYPYQGQGLAIGQVLRSIHQYQKAYQ